MQKSNAVSVARHKARLRAAGGRVMSLALDPESVKAAEYLVRTGWATSLTGAVNRAIQALAQAQQMVKGESHGNRN